MASQIDHFVSQSKVLTRILNELVFIEQWSVARSAMIHHGLELEMDEPNSAAVPRELAILKLTVSASAPKTLQRQWGHRSGNQMAVASRMRAGISLHRRFPNAQGNCPCTAVMSHCCVAPLFPMHGAELAQARRPRNHINSTSVDSAEFHAEPSPPHGSAPSPFHGCGGVCARARRQSFSSPGTQ